MDHFPEGEKVELLSIYRSRGYSEADAHALVEIQSRDKKRWVDAMMVDELSMLPDERKPLLSGLATLVAFVIAGAILADVGKLLEYETGPDGPEGREKKLRQSERGELLRHPFTGVALAMECGVPDAVCHIIAAHAAEGDQVKRTTEAYIVHHADFMAYLPFNAGGPRER